MTAVLVYLGASLGRRWRGWLGLALLIGLFGAAVEGAAAGARRTDAAYPLLVAWSRPPDLLTFSYAGRPTFARIPAGSLERLPQVTAGAELATFVTVNPAAALLIAPAGRQVPGSMWHRKILSGRLPDPRRPDEVDVSFTLAQAEHLVVGSTLRVVALSYAGRPVSFRFRVTGINAAPGEFPPQFGTGTDFVWATPAFYWQHRAGLSYPTVALWLRRGASDVPAVQQEASGLARGKAVSSYPFGSQAANTERSIHLQAVALWLVALVLVAVGALVIGQLVARQTYIESADYAGLRALGMSRGQLMGIGLGRAAAIGAAGAVAALAAAVGLSPLFPVGLAGVADPGPGLDADGLVLGLGLIAVPVVTVACAAWPAWRAAGVAGRRTPPGQTLRPGRPVLLGAALGSVTGMIGIRLAMQRGAGRTALPVRSTIAGAVVGVAALSGAIVFSSSLDHLLSSPALYGVTWDATVDNLQSGSLAPAARSIESDPQVAAWSGAYAAVPLEVRGDRARPADEVGGLATTQGQNASLLRPTLIAGRLPQRADEIVLGERTLAAIHARIGTVVGVSISGFSSRARLKIVGTAILPPLDDTIGLGSGAVVTAQGLRGLAPARLPLPAPDEILARFRPGLSPDAGIQALAARLERLGPFAVVGPSTPADLVNFGEEQHLPLLLGVSLGVLALLTIAHLLITSVRRRRRDLAVLRTIGFTRSQVRSTVAWQAVTLVVVALVIGIPAGIALGRLAWTIFAHQLGILPVVDVPLPYLALMAAATIAVAVAIAALPGESAARARPARVLRSE